MPTQSPFLDFVTEEMYKRRYAKRTVETYLHWIRFYILFHKKQHPKDLAEQHVEQFLTYLAVNRHVAVPTAHRVQLVMATAKQATAHYVFYGDLHFTL